MLRPDSEDGFFHDGNPALGQKGTKVGADILNALLELLTGFGPGVRVVAGNCAVLETDGVLLVDASAGPVTLTLLSAASNNARILTVIKTDASDNAVTLQAQAGETLPTGEGRQEAADLAIQDESIRIMPDGASHWYRIG